VGKNQETLKKVRKNMKLNNKTKNENKQEMKRKETKSRKEKRQQKRLINNCSESSSSTVTRQKVGRRQIAVRESLHKRPGG
jgi:hypothetical protein